ncbi:MAG TPA: ABC transporter permease [Gemmatimonadales bacterium]|jgi:putative ABC transport system permease protein|nr:ABC transporter permease [Gemmatimonadales bacterium]
MRWLSNLAFRLRALLRPGRAERELTEEVEFHLEMETRKLIGQGMAPEQAAREARLRFGGVAYQQESARNAWGIRVLRDFLGDVRHAGRQFRRRPGFTFLAVITLALGIGATVALFSVVRGLLLRPLPVQRESELQVFWSDWDWRGSEFDFIKERARVFSGLAAYTVEGLAYRTDAGSELVMTGVTSAEFFDVIGARPLLGRTFAPGEDRPGAEPVVVLSWTMWRQELGGDAKVLGRRIILDGTPTTVIGVMPRGFYFPSPEYRAWRPLVLDPNSPVYRGRGWLVLFGRVKPGTTVGALSADVQAIARALGERFTYSAAWDKSKGARVHPLREYLLGSVKPALLLLLGAVGLLLLMACANTAALVLARTTDRTGEIGLRLALGAGRGRLIRQIVTESVTLSLLAGGAGAVVAVGLFRRLVASLPLQSGFGEAVTLDWMTFAAGVGLAVLVGLMVSAIPVRHLLQGRLSGLSGERVVGVRVGPGRAHAVLVAAEVMLAVLLVSGATLLIRSVGKLYALDPGFDPKGVVTADLIASGEEMDRPVRWQFFREMLERVKAVPGVTSAGYTNRLPVRDGGWQGPIEVESRPDLREANRPNCLYRTVTPDYLRTMGMEIRAGRGVEATDREGSAPVVLVSESFARKMWPGENPLGRRVRTGFMGDSTWLTVVGVVEETRMFTMTGENPIVMYLPWEQSGFPGEGQVLAMRTGADPGAVIAAVRRLVRELDRRVAVARPAGIEEVVRTALAEPLRLRFFLMLFAGLALVLGTVGVYGVVSYAVTRRRSEFGIRMALGAAPGKVLAEVVRGGMAPVALGVGAGLVGAVALSRLLARFLYAVAPTDPASLAVAGAALLGAGVLAALLPGWRAGQVNPVEALRAE